VTVSTASSDNNFMRICEVRLLKFPLAPDHLTFMSSLCVSICDSKATSFLRSRETLLTGKANNSFLFLWNIFFSDPYDFSFSFMRILFSFFAPACFIICPWATD
jgi:hypothetical protein